MAPGIPRSHKPLFPTNGAAFVRTDVKFSTTMNVQFLNGLLSKALPKCSSVRRSCIAYGHYQFLPGILAIAAECYHFLGEDSTSKKRYYQAYVLYDALDDQDELENVALEMKKHFNICISI